MFGFEHGDAAYLRCPFETFWPSSGQRHREPRLVSWVRAANGEEAVAWRQAI